jgi:hypothetical protein
VTPRPVHTTFPALCLCLALVARAADSAPQASVNPPAPTKPILEKGVIYVRGAVPAASDPTTPLPEDGKVVDGRYRNAYFGLSCPLLPHWTEEPAGPPPSNSGSYVLTQFTTQEHKTTRVKASVLVSAQDLFFSPIPLAGPLEMLQVVRKHLSQNFKVEHEPEEVERGGRRFARLAYSAPSAGLHWRLLSTEVRCHALLFTISGTDRASLDAAERTVSGRAFTADAVAPPCQAGYVNDANVVARVQPHLEGHHFNPIPVRILIDPAGAVAHIHLLSAFPEQAERILAAVRQWHFKPYLRDGQAMALETGVMFGRVPTVMRRPELPLRAPKHGDSGQ